MRTIKSLLNQKGRVYVFLRDTETALRFIRMAEGEGFTYGDGAALSSREISDIYALNGDFTVNTVGFAGHMAFYAKSGRIVRVDFAEYVSGGDDYILKGTV